MDLYTATAINSLSNQKLHKLFYDKIQAKKV